MTVVNVLFGMTISRAVASNSDAKTYAKTCTGYLVNVGNSRKVCKIRWGNGVKGWWYISLSGASHRSVFGVKGGVLWEWVVGCVLGLLCRLRSLKVLGVVVSCYMV